MHKSSEKMAVKAFFSKNFHVAQGAEMGIELQVNGSVGEALDYGAAGPWFDPGARPNALLLLETGT